MPLHTLRADIDYGTALGGTAYGIIGIKVWIFKGEIMEHDPMAQENKALEAQEGGRSGGRRDGPSQSLPVPAWTATVRIAQCLVKLTTESPLANGPPDPSLQRVRPPSRMSPGVAIGRTNLKCGMMHIVFVSRCLGLSSPAPAVCYPKILPKSA